jgi:hypothetical protein
MHILKNDLYVQSAKIPQKKHKAYLPEQEKSSPNLYDYLFIIDPELKEQKLKI